MLLAICALLSAGRPGDRRKQEANSEKREANISQSQWEDGVPLIQIFIFNP